VAELLLSISSRLEPGKWGSRGNVLAHSRARLPFFGLIHRARLESHSSPLGHDQKTSPTSPFPPTSPPAQEASP
jgi:hypothetical protein